LKDKGEQLTKEKRTYTFAAKVWAWEAIENSTRSVMRVAKSALGGEIELRWQLVLRVINMLNIVS
jgi:hypothetical protein